MTNISKNYIAEIKQLFATKYMPFLPTVEELQAEIEREKLAFKMLREKK